MALLCQVLAVLFVLSLVSARPAVFDSKTQYEQQSIANANDEQWTDLRNPQVYFVIAEAIDDNEDEAGAPFVSDNVSLDDDIEKRSVEREADDLETAAGTNVLRPLFVYRQQLAYRERVKKGAVKRFGIRPRF